LGACFGYWVRSLEVGYDVTGCENLENRKNFLGASNNDQKQVSPPSGAPPFREESLSESSLGKEIAAQHPPFQPTSGMKRELSSPFLA
jgi:hypothetical protein